MQFDYPMDWSNYPPSNFDGTELVIVQSFVPSQSGQGGIPQDSIKIDVIAMPKEQSPDTSPTNDAPVTTTTVTVEGISRTVDIYASPEGGPVYYSGILAVEKGNVVFRASILATNVDDVARGVSFFTSLQLCDRLPSG